MIAGRLLIASAVCLITVSASAADRPPIIDMHLHAPATLERSAGGAPLPRPCFPLLGCPERRTVARADEDVLRLTLEAMERHNIVLGFLSDSMENVASWMRQAPNRFLPSPMISDPADVDLAELRRSYASGELRGLGELTTQYRGIPADDTRMEPLFALAEELDLPVLLHSAGTGAPSDRFRISHGHPERLQEVLVRHPRLRLSVENAGFPFADQMIALMYRYPTVYADLSTITWIVPRPMFQRHLRALVDAGLAKRLMFGSDQMQWPEIISEAIEAVDSVEFLTLEQKRDIFYNNAVRFLRLKARK